MLPLAVDRSSFGGVAIRYVFPVLWMTSLFHIMAPMAARHYRSSVTAASCTGNTLCPVIDDGGRRD